MVATNSLYLSLGRVISLVVSGEYLHFQHPTLAVQIHGHWMTSTIFVKWLINLNRDMVKQDRHIALLIDNCFAHPKDSGGELTYMYVLYFLPPNVTSVVQPCDMDNLKALY